MLTWQRALILLLVLGRDVVEIRYRNTVLLGLIVDHSHVIIHITKWIILKFCDIYFDCITWASPDSKMLGITELYD